MTALLTCLGGVVSDMRDSPHVLCNFCALNLSAIPWSGRVVSNVMAGQRCCCIAVLLPENTPSLRFPWLCCGFHKLHLVLAWECVLGTTCGLKPHDRCNPDV